LDLAFNICMPIDHIENNQVKPIFEKIFAWAEAIEVKWPRNGKTSDLFELSGLTENSASYGHPGARVFAVPEAVAEIASYIFSLERTEGLHAVIDFGAGTTDVSIFNLTNVFNQQWMFWFNARNIPWGMVQIERLLVQQMVSYIGIGRILTGHTLSDLIISLKEESPSLDENPIESIRDQVKEKFEEFASSQVYKLTWGKAYGRLTNQELWRNVKIFVGGGGCKAPFIDQIFSIPWCYPNVQEAYPIKQLPEPRNYDSLAGKAPFYRMAVAYGLAIPAPQLSNYDLPGECPDNTPPRKNVRDIPDYDD